ncbi:MAG TPA: glycosyltransferase family 2 protein [Acidimicrobiales bacterium]|nr:glycosyltransferase family 2 protein [Acidimicrobiales bacterium]
MSGPEQDFEARYPGIRLAPVTVIIPAYDEEQTVASVVASVPAEMSGLATSVLVVDDGSRDRTAERAAGAGAYVHRQANGGQGAALRAGYRVAASRGAEILATLDADGQWSAADLAPMVELVARGEADLVSGSRRLGSDQVTERARQAGVVVFGRLITVLTGQAVTDPANGLRVMKADVARTVRLEQPQFQAAELLLSALSAGFRYREVPVAHLPRQAGVSKKGNDLLYGARYGAAVVRTYVRDRGWRHRGRA